MWKERSMSPVDEFHEADITRIIWLSQEEEENKIMNTALAPNDLHETAQAREKLNTRVAGAIVAVTLTLAAGLLYNVYKIEQPWIRVGQAWTLAVLAYLVFAQFTPNRPRIGASEPCAQFLQRQHEERRCGYLRLRNRLFLFIPGIVACWWGNASLIVSARFSPASFVSQPGSWLFLTTGAGLVLVWLAFGKAADKAARDRDELGRRIGK
jgi:hypothetical protein